MAVEYPIVEEVTYDASGIAALQAMPDERNRSLLLDYPTVYIIGSSKTKNERMLYVGETTDIEQRTIQHLDEDPKNRDDWRVFAEGKNQQMIVIGHNHFNKSMTLDIENQLMLYLSGSETTHSLINRRTNPQGEYYPKDEREQIFSRIWRKLHAKHPEIFLTERAIRDSALFKASPFHKLTLPQENAKALIISKVIRALKNDTMGELILVQGEAGSGKTVLLSSVFYDLMTSLNSEGDITNSNAEDHSLSAKLMVNHNQQLTVYQQIMAKLGLYTQNGDEVGKPTHFINAHKGTDKPFDVILVDEAHLLYTQGKQSYRGKNQLDDLRKISRVVVAVLDPHQVLATNEYLTEKQFEHLQMEAAKRNNSVVLSDQLRMQADKYTLTWLYNFLFQQRITPIPVFDAKHFDLKIFSSPVEMEHAIRAKAQDEAHGLSRMLATFDWPYVEKKRPDANDPLSTWNVQVGEWSMPWNLQLPATTKHQAKLNKKLAWAEQPQTINEIGSTFTIQGLDLNYAGVVLGPSVGYKDGHVIWHTDRSANHNATQRRTIGDKKIDVTEELLKNEVNVLMSRGVHGLYLYAVDQDLRQALLQAQAHTGELPMVAESTDDE